MKTIAARWFTETTGRPYRLVVVHSMEAPDKPDTAEAVGDFFARLPADRKASAHIGCDRDSAVRYVKDKDVAYAAPGANNDGLHVELTGFARYTSGDWAQPQMMSMLSVAADQVRDWCEKYSIPIRFLDAAAVRRGEKGITTHVEVSKAYRRSDHWDPGTNFPMQTFLSMVAATPPPMGTEDDMETYFELDCPTGGYWIVKRSDGGVFGYDGAPFFGSCPGENVKLQAPIVAMEPYVKFGSANDGKLAGYWLLSADGGVFAFGEAPFRDSYAGHPEWHQGTRQFVDIEQHGAGYDLISVVVGSDPPERNVYDLSVKR